MAHALAASPDPSQVLTKAVSRAASRLGLSSRELAAILGVSAATVSRLGRSRNISPQGKEGELALLLLRVFRSLDALLGADAEQARSWLRSVNRHLGGVPAELIQSAGGLVHVADYLDAMRGKS